MALHGLVASGWLVVFAVRADRALVVSRQQSRDNSWSEWEELAPLVTSGPAAVRNVDRRLEVFARGPDGLVGHAWETKPEGAWAEWDDFGVEITGTPAVFQNADGRIELFASGADGVLGHMWQLVPGGYTGWSEWLELGPALDGDPVVFQNIGGHLEVFGRGPGGVLGHTWQNPPDGEEAWSPWEELGPVLTADPVAFINVTGQLELFGRGPDGILGHTWQVEPMQGWAEWHDFGPEITGRPAVFQNADGRMELFGRGPDDVLGHQWQTQAANGWDQWFEFGPAKVWGDPVAFQNADGRLEVFARGEDGLLGHLWQHELNGLSGWSDWADLGIAVAADRPAVVQTAAEQADVRMQTMVDPRTRSAAPATTTRSADICVVGAGPAGITLSDGLIQAGASVCLVESGDMFEDARARELNEGPADSPLLKGRLGYLTSSRRREVQGSAAQWGPGFMMPLRPIDYAPRSWVDRSGWPLTAEDMAPWEERAAETFGFPAFAAPAEDGSLVRVAYQFPPDPQLFRGRYLDMLPNPLFRPELRTTLVELNVKGDRIVSARCARANGDELVVEADTFVLAAGAIENARILLLNDRTLPASAMAGRYFMEHPHLAAGTVKLPDTSELRSLLDGGASVDVLALSDAVQADERLLNVNVQLQPRGGHAEGPVECVLFARSEQAPNPASRVHLGEGRDRLGQQQVVLRWETLTEDWTSIVDTVDLVAQELEERYGAQAEVLVSREKPWPADPGVSGHHPSHSAWGNHHMGTTRMDDDVSEGVVDRNCRLHGTANLYVAGSSVFPTGGAANPTFTIVALAHRLVDQLADQSR